MTPQELQKLRFPIGPFEIPEQVSAAMLQSYISTLAQHPAKLRQAVEGLSEEQINTPYRPGGWTIRQVVHHLGDSHINAFVRFRLALTEQPLTIKPYQEDKWGEFIDNRNLAIEPSLQLLTGLHARWTYMLAGMSADDWKREYIHPEHGRSFSLDQVAANYAWHCDHHLAHIQNTVFF